MNGPCSSKHATKCGTDIPEPRVTTRPASHTGVLNWKSLGSPLESATEGAVGNRGAPESAQGNWGAPGVLLRVLFL